MVSRPCTFTNKGSGKITSLFFHSSTIRAISFRREWQLQRSNTTRQILKNFTIIDRGFLFMNAKLEKFCQSCLNFQFEFVNNHIFGVEIWFAIRIVIRG